MTDDRVVRLLEELRDLHQAHVANYRQALRNQEESIRLQQAGLRRVRWILLAGRCACLRCRGSGGTTRPGVLIGGFIAGGRAPDGQ